MLSPPHGDEVADPFPSHLDEATTREVGLGAVANAVVGVRPLPLAARNVDTHVSEPRRLPRPRRLPAGERVEVPPTHPVIPSAHGAHPEAVAGVPATAPHPLPRPSLRLPSLAETVGAVGDVAGHGVGVVGEADIVTPAQNGATTEAVRAAGPDVLGELEEGYPVDGSESR